MVIREPVHRVPITESQVAGMLDLIENMSQTHGDDIYGQMFELRAVLEGLPNFYSSHAVALTGAGVSAIERGDYIDFERPDA